MQRPKVSPSGRPPPAGKAGLLPLIGSKKTPAARADPLAPGPGGYLQMVERGQLPASYDLEPALTTAGPMRSVRAPIHATRSRERARVMTETSGFSRMQDYKLDFSEIENIPAKMNVAELRTWEAEEAAYRARVATPPPPPEQQQQQQSQAADAADDDAALFRDDARTYTELLDLYSMHEFIIRKGKTLRNTPEFASFKRHYIASWGNIESFIQGLEDFLTSYGIEMAYIDGKKVAELASYQLGYRLTAAEFLECVANIEDVEPLVGNAREQYHYASDGHHRAAAKIQSVWRMYRQRISYMHLLVGTRAAVIIQRQWALHRAHTVTRRAIAARREAQLARWRQTMEDFTAKWPRIREGRRTEVHLPSLSFPACHARAIPFYEEQQAGQLARLAALRDPNVHVVLVVPFKPEPEVVAYYHALLAGAGADNTEGRLTVLVPEDARRLPEGMSLTRQTLLSSRVMKLLAALCKGRPAYVVPGVIGADELTVAAQLNVPLLAAEPLVAQVFGSKSGVHRLLESADVAAPTGATQLRSRGDLYRALASLMAEHRDVARWLVKIDSEAGSRGHAYFDTGRLRALKDQHLAPRPETVAAVARELEEEGHRRVRIVSTASYPDWSAFLATFDLMGGCVEAVPARPLGTAVANLLIEPTGDVQLQSVVEGLQSPAFTALGTCYPCTAASFPYEAVRGAALSVGRAAFRKRIIGYVSVDFVLFERPSLLGPAAPALVRLWGVDVDLRWTPAAAAHRLAEAATGAAFDPATGLAPLPGGGHLSYAFSDIVYNPYISCIKHAAFFSLCHSKGVSFDSERRRGAIFHVLVNTFCALCVGDDFSQAVRKLAEFQSLLGFELPKEGEHTSESNFVCFSTVTRQLVRIAKALHKGAQPAA